MTTSEALPLHCLIKTLILEHKTQCSFAPQWSINERSCMHFMEVVSFAFDVMNSTWNKYLVPGVSKIKLLLMFKIHDIW